MIKVLTMTIIGVLLVVFGLLMTIAAINNIQPEGLIGLPISIAGFKLLRKIGDNPYENKAQ